MKKESKNNILRKAAMKKAAVFLSPLIVVYLGISGYFANHFYYNTVINSVNVSGQTVKEAEAAIAAKMSTYNLKLQGRNNVSEDISGEDIDLKYDSNTTEVKKIKKSQNPLTWIKGFWGAKNNLEVDVVSYDENLLNEKINELSFLKSENIIEPKNATFECINNKFEIKEEVKGTKIKEDVLETKVKEAVKDGKTKLDLDKEGCYENPKYTKDSKEISETKDKLNSMIDFKVTYDLGNKKEVIDGNTISKWLEVSDDLEIDVNEDAVKDFVYKLASKYNTFGGTRKFNTTEDGTIDVSGGNYGWIINQKAEREKLIEELKANKSVEREPIYEQTGISRDSNGNDIGNTYVEINMTKQHLWFYKNGSLVTQGDVVTGNAALNFSTPVGVYRLNYKEKDATLKGENYESAVTYWMPFNNNIGIHDASWRSEFGGQIYLTSGSHGCVNAPYALAEAIFKEIEPGTPIVCYY